MVKFLNFLYKGFAFAKPRFGIKETFWVFGKGYNPICKSCSC